AWPSARSSAATWRSSGSATSRRRKRKRRKKSVADTAERSSTNVARNWLGVMQTCNPPKGRVDPVSRWLVLTRACVQPMTITAAAVAGLLAVHEPGFNSLLYGLAAAGIILAHAANNLMNHLFDLDVGPDTADYPRA